MKIAISGASGFIGTRLAAYLEGRGFGVVRLGREHFADDAHERLVQAVGECDAVVNLAGATIDHRWSRRYKEELLSSRIETTRKLVAAVDASLRTQTLISTSAVGYYPSVGCYDEYSAEQGSGFLSDLCASWEAAARCVAARCVITRFGVVLAADGGVFPRLARPAKAGVALVAGSGLQPFSWISIGDLLRAEEFLLTNVNLDGVFNLAAPEELTQREFVGAVAEHYRSPLTVCIPAFAVQLVRGEAADFLLHGQCAVPSRLRNAGFRFDAPSAQIFLQSL